MAEFDQQVAVNMRAPLFIIQRALPLLRDGGRIINISSAVTRLPMSPRRGIRHDQSRHRRPRQALPLAAGAQGITVNTVAPGPVDTGLVPLLADPDARAQLVAGTALRRIGEPADIADVVAFLASDQARWITGTSWTSPAAWFSVPAPDEAAR